jgi:hypothetical protein
MKILVDLLFKSGTSRCFMVDAEDDCTRAEAEEVAKDILAFYGRSKKEDMKGYINLGMKSFDVSDVSMIAVEVVE